MDDINSKYQSLCELYELDNELMSDMTLYAKVRYLFDKNVRAEDAFIILCEHHSAVDIYAVTTTILSKE